MRSFDDEERSGGSIKRSHSIQETEEFPEIRNDSAARRKKTRPPKVSLTRLAKLNKPEVPILVVGAVAAVIRGLSMPVFAFVLSSSISIYFEDPSKMRKHSRILAIVFLGIGLVNLVMVPTQSYSLGVVGGKLVQRIRGLTFSKVIHQQISWFDDPANSRYSKRNLERIVLLNTTQIPVPKFMFFGLDFIKTSGKTFSNKYFPLVYLCIFASTFLALIHKQLFSIHTFN